MTNKCPKCSGTETEIKDGKGPHAKAQHCRSCGCWLKWLQVVNYEAESKAVWKGFAARSMINKYR